MSAPETAATEPDRENAGPLRVAIYTAGACEPSPGPGGYGAVLVYGKHRRELSGGFRLTTKDRMEIYAAIKALDSLKTSCKVTLYSDSEYLVKAMGLGWVKRWKRRAWRSDKRETVANIDLWKRMLALCEKHQVEFIWVQKHAGHPESERCAQLARIALEHQDLLQEDAGYTPKE